MKSLSFSLVLLICSVFTYGQELSKARWSIKSFSSQELSGEGANGRASQIIDGDVSTYWHSQWQGGSASLPHEFQVDLGDSCSITGIKLWPRQSNCSGKPVQYEYYISNDGTNWGTAVKTGSFSWASANDNNPQTVTFSATQGRYIRFRQLSTFACGSAGIGCVAEMDVIGKYSKLYSASAKDQPIDHVLPGASDCVILPILLEVYDSKPLQLTNLRFVTTGTTDLGDISDAKVYLTGSSPSFNTNNRFGSVSMIQDNNSVTGNASLSPGSNYLWITYTVNSTAKVGNYLDAVLQSITVSDSIITPKVTDPAGKRMIMGVQLTEFPMNKQLYPRDRATNMATVTIAGSVTDVNHSTTAIKVAVLRNGVSVDTLKYIPSFSGATAGFSINYSLKAELQNYTFKLFSENDGRLNLVQTAQEVVAGDAYIVTGQSNGVATIWWGETTTEIENPFIRTFGSGVASGAYTKEWFKAVTHDPKGSAANGAACDGQVGVLGLSIGRQLVDAYSVPIAILNGAHGGKEIAFFAKSASNPTDINSNYGRLLTRLNESKLKNSVEGIIWYQGENDASISTSFANYQTSFTNLRAAWKSDMPQVKKIYVFQIKQGCGAGVDKVNVIQEAQRRLPSLCPEVTVMSTNAVKQQEGCHFPKAGYVTHATNVVRNMKVDFYGEQDTVDIEAPDVWYISLVAENEIAITTDVDSEGGLVWENGAHADFKLENTTNTIIGGRVENSTIYLTTSSPFSHLLNAKISYLGRGAVGTPTVKNQLGIGLLCFNQYPIYKGNQFIEFIPLPDSVLKVGEVTLNAVASSGLAVTYSSSDESVASIAGDKMTIHKKGTVTITATQAGNSLYAPAKAVSVELNIADLSNIEETNFGSVRIFPNPVEDELFVRSETPIENIELLSATGLLISRFSNSSKSENESRISVSDLTSGVYFVRVKVPSQGVKIVRFIKK